MKINLIEYFVETVRRFPERNAIIDGERKQVASATCSIRPGRSMTFSVDVQQDLSQLSEEDRKAIAVMFEDYLAEEETKASELGIPIVN